MRLLAHAAKAAGRLDGLLADTSDPPLAEAVEAFMAVANDWRYRTTFNWIEREAPAGARLSWLVDTDTVQALLNGRLRSGRRPGTVARDKAALSAFLGYHLGEARRRQVLRRVRVKQPNSGRVRWLDSEEIDRLRAVSGDWWVLWALLLSTGVRRGEALGLRVEDVDFEESALRVWGTKSKAAERTVPLEGEVVGLLRGWIAANDLDGQDPLFPGLNRSRGWYVWRAWRDCCRVAGINGATVHDLRHTYAVHAVKAGMPLTALQRRLGHSRMQETWRYASYVPEKTEHVAATLGRMGLGPNTSPNNGGRARVVSGSQSHQPCQNQPRRRGS